MSQSQYVFLMKHELKNALHKKLPKEKYCLCCLRRNLKYVNLGSCNHRSFIEYISKVKIEYGEMFICYYCHAMLKKFEEFKQKVEQNFAIINNQAINSTQQSIYSLGKTYNINIDTRRPVANVCVTRRPGAQTPVTQTPVTQTPVTQTPVKKTPVTQTPVTQIPVTQRLAKETPLIRKINIIDNKGSVKQIPVTQIPVTQLPVTQLPVTQLPVTQLPVTQTPVTQLPVTQIPVTQLPVTQTPVTQTPVTQTPVTQTPVTQTPITRIPVTQTHNTNSLNKDPLEVKVEKEIDYDEIILQNVAFKDSIDRPTLNEEVDIAFERVEFKQEVIDPGNELLPLKLGIESEHNYVSRFTYNDSETESETEIGPLIKKMGRKDKVLNSDINMTEKPNQNYLTAKTAIAQSRRIVEAVQGNFMVIKPLTTYMEAMEPTESNQKRKSTQEDFKSKKKTVPQSLAISSAVKGNKVEKEYIEIIKTVLFNEDEMKLWRENERKKPAFLNLPHKCHDCIVGFDHELRLQKHIKAKHTMSKGVNILCVICKTVWKSQAKFVLHTKRHFTVYECAACGFRAKTPITIPEHYRVAHGAIDRKYVCEHCDFVTDSYRQSRTHRYKHKSRAECDLCHKSYNNRASLWYHVLQVHKLKRKPMYTCKPCGKSYGTRSRLTLHEKVAHSKTVVEPVYCAKCDKTFRTAESLNKHLVNHSNHVDVYKFICDHCGAKYRSKTSLINHMEYSHLKVNQLECPTCKKVCRGPRALQNHIKNVHNRIDQPRDKICDQCGKGFTTNEILQSHLRTHSGERPFQCDKCPDTFGHKGAMYTHKKLVHNGKPKKRQRRSKVKK